MRRVLGETVYNLTHVRARRELPQSLFLVLKIQILIGPIVPEKSVQWHLSPLSLTILLPMHELGARLLRKAIGAGRTLPAHLRPEHVIPTVFGAINFPYLDAETIERAYGVDVHSDAYIRRQARLVAKILRALLESA